jgi:hypothetical protein
MGGEAKPTGFFLGEGGSIFEMDLPLPEVMQDKVTRGQLRQVNQDGSPYEAHGAMDLATGEFRVPGKNANKNEWVGYAVSQGMSVDEADGMTKADLIDKFGPK